MKIIAAIESVIISLSFVFSCVFNLPKKDVQKFISDNGGFIYGICQPDEDYDMLKDVGLKWIRIDTPCPFDKNGYIRNEYKEFKLKCQKYKDNGFKIMVVTPYPKDFISDMEFNPVEDIERLKSVAVFLYNDLKEISDGFQISNEMGIEGFTRPLTLEQAVLFLGAQLEAISEVKENFPIGYNSAGINEELHNLMKPYLQYCDYVGADLYDGLQGRASVYSYTSSVSKIYRITHKPVILMEFGFWSLGGRKTAEEKAEILAKYGYSSAEEAIADGENFISKLPEQFQNTLKETYPNEEERWPEIVLTTMANHFYGTSSALTINNIPHTPDGQAEYFTQVMTGLKKMNCVAGMIIYTWKDSEVCAACGHDYCPYECKFGLRNYDGTPKPAYYAVREVITGKK